MKKNIVFIFLVILIINQVIFFSCRKKSESCSEYLNKISSEALEWRPYIKFQQLIFKNKVNNIKDTLICKYFISGNPASDVHYSDRELHSKCEKYITYYDIYYCGLESNKVNFTYALGKFSVMLTIDSVNYNYDVLNMVLDTAKINNIYYNDVYKSNNTFISKTYGILKFEYNDSLYELVR